VTAGPIDQSLRGLAFEAQTPRGPVKVRSRLVGHFNVYNLLAAVSTGVALELPTEAIESGLAALTRVPGRFQVVSTGADDVTVVVDYAHTDDALKNLLETARPLASRRLVTVFGCGGDRDRTKRPLMGAVAARLSDIVVVTSDNPRSEDPAAIIDEVLRGVGSRADRASVRGEPGGSAPGPATMAIVDRREAIERAIHDAQAGDLVVIAGKGHEQYQELGGRTIHFDDVEIARDALSRRRSTGTA
jgi:UDP-N-acetylmuramoyl-L-alanyl-D-glutamate--2,6-diaminopimelate ligase